MQQWTTAPGAAETLDQAAIGAGLAGVRDGQQIADAGAPRIIGADPPAIEILLGAQQFGELDTGARHVLGGHGVVVVGDDGGLEGEAEDLVAPVRPMRQSAARLGVQGPGAAVIGELDEMVDRR